MENPTQSLSLGTVLHGYRLERILGQGAFGITYLAKDESLSSYVAIKEYYPREFAVRDSTKTVHSVGNAEDRETFSWGLKRFLEEARILAQLSHPNVIKVRHFFQGNGTAYLVMDYCDGAPLDAIIKQNGPLSLFEAKALFDKLLSGIDHIHKNNILHRDIKPANIFIKTDGNPVLLDFGAARSNIGLNSKSVTSLATAGYAPFEQYSTKGNQGSWSDYYGLAATMYRVLTGEKPQDSPDRILDDQLVPLVKQFVTEAGHFRHFLATLDKCLEIRPEERPQSIDQIHALISGKQSTKSELTPSITVRPGYVSQPISTLGLGKAALSGVIVAGLLLTLIAVYFYIDLNSPTISPPTTSADKNQPTPPPESEKVQPLDQNTNEEAKVRLVEEEKRLKEEIRKLEQSRLDDERSRRESAELEARRKRKEEQDFKEALVRQDAERARLDDERRRRVEEERRLYEERLAAASREELSRKIDSILAEGDSCFASMKFDCSISMAKAALSLAPNDVRAQRLRDQALAAQRRALGQIVIQ